MNKELTLLEVFSKVLDIICCQKHDDNLQKYLDIIENALKKYELIKEQTKLDSFECLLRLEEILPRGKELLIPVARQLKALEIVKEKRVDVQVLHYSIDRFEYNKRLVYGEKSLTEEEYDLLKEVLL